MRVLFDILHPAHLHLFRHLILRLHEAGEEPVVLTRHKDVTVGLCDGYGIRQKVISRFRGGFVPGAWEMLVRTTRVFLEARRAKADALIGTSLSIGFVGRLLGIPSFVVNEDNREISPLFAKIAYPLADWIVTPECLACEDYGERHLTYAGYHELAYLHPNHFTPDPEVPRRLGIEPGKPFFILRFVALKAHHDTATRGIGHAAARELVDLLAAHGRVLITSEGELHPDFREHQFPLGPDQLHDVLAFASIYAGDSQTMAAEAAVLGVPSIRCTTLGQHNYLRDLEKFDLFHDFLPEQFEEVLSTVRGWLEDLDATHALHRERRQAMLERSVDVADWQWHMLWRTLHEKAG